ncbi:Wzz/FepE/Etk N-terminal domain-containing protein [Dermatophilus congolensis]|nr:Wzz/FepE/Etk N-terminal domain-containing protein [Dermatophilus congolensis]MBO3130029.1 hypothetical protein [Dermatophilus congolensis]MBO3131341.1 hypothetical protein [Dermatophilus congolensis]MBO3134503.1 hypothetical protein [Dermatophilus congolensis]MBO3136738.1 hypothetical protein [Dermatophilus congolensis]MBO3138983.1 hypothetical protein [Dermatophilus congolensis]
MNSKKNKTFRGIKVTFMDMLRLIRKNLIMIGALAVLGGVIGGSWAALTPTTYTSTATLAVVPAQGTGNANQDPMTGAIASMMQTFATSTTTGEVLSPVKQSVTPEESLDTLRKRIKVNVPTASTLLEITATGTSSNEAVSLADATADSLSKVVGQLAPKNPTNGQPTMTTVRMTRGADSVTTKGVSTGIYVLGALITGFVIALMLARARANTPNTNAAAITPNAAPAEHPATTSLQVTEQVS